MEYPYLLPWRGGGLQSLDFHVFEGSLLRRSLPLEDLQGAFTIRVLGLGVMLAATSNVFVRRVKSNRQDLVDDQVVEAGGRGEPNVLDYVTRR